MSLTQERSSDSHGVKLIEFYKDYSPPNRVYETVRKMLDRVPQQYIQGLDCVVLTNMSGQPRHRRLGKIPSSKGRVSKSRVLGLYHGKHRGKSPWIEIYVDKIAERHKTHLWIPFMRDAVFGEVLLHEIGHHIHATITPEHSDEEYVAERWKKKLTHEIWRNRNRFWRLTTKYFVIPPFKLALCFLRARKRAIIAQNVKARP